MKVTSRLFLLTTGIMAQFCSYAQIGGNQVYQERYSRNYGEEGNAYKTVMIKDSIMQVTASVLLNAKADYFVVTMSVNEEGKTIKEVNAAINEGYRILKKLCAVPG